MVQRGEVWSQMVPKELVTGEASKTLNIYFLVASEASSKHSTKVGSPRFDCELKNNTS